MGGKPKWGLGLFLAGILLVIALTWGSIGSAVLTLALILSIGFLLLRRSLQAQEDFFSDEEVI